MAASVFSEKSEMPDSAALDAALGKSSALLKDIEEHVLDQFGPPDHEWKFYSKTAGWTMALVHGGRRIFHLIPLSGLFTVVFTLGDRAVTVAMESSLPDEVKSEIDGARKYAEGRSIRHGVSTAADVEIVKQLVTIKLAGKVL